VKLSESAEIYIFAETIGIVQLGRILVCDERANLRMGSNCRGCGGRFRSR
jgi:hypothetical protein